MTQNLYLDSSPDCNHKLLTDIPAGDDLEYFIADGDGELPGIELAELMQSQELLNH